MRIVIPVSAADLHLLDTFVELYRALGGSPRQHVVLLPTSNVTAQAKQAADKMAPYAASTRVIEWENDNAGGKWPIPGNNMWKHAIMKIEKLNEAGDAQSMYYFELDNTMLKPMCFDAVESEYAMSGCRFMGAVVPTRVLVNNEIKLLTEDSKNPPHMVGTGIYPPGIPKLTDGVWITAKFQPWDIFLTHYFRRSLHATRLIQHRWSTINYREIDASERPAYADYNLTGVAQNVNGKEIVCDNDPKNPFGTDHSGPVNEDAVILHGAKDGSLARLILARLGTPASIAPAAMISVPQLTERTATNVGAPKVSYDKTAWRETQRKQHENGTDVIVEAMMKKPDPTPEAPQKALKINIGGKPEKDIKKIMECITKSRKSLRPASVSDLTGVPVNRIVALAEQEDSPFTLTKPSRWLKVREAVTA